MPAEPITMLSGLNTVELTLTKRGANNRRFALTKGGLPMDPEVIQALISTAAEGEDALIETLKSQGVTDQEKIDAAVASYRIQKGMKDLVPDDVMANVAKSAGYELAAKADPKPEPKADPKPEPKAPARKSLDLSNLDDKSRAAVEAVFKSHDAQVEKSSQLEAMVKSLSETVTSLKDERETQQYVAKAESDFGHLPMSGTEIAAMLKSAHSVGGEFAAGFETMLGRVDEMISKSAMLTVMGNVRKQAEGGAWSKLENLADGIVTKSAGSEHPMTKAQAMDFVLKTEEGKALYREYLGDNPSQRAEVY